MANIGMKRDQHLVLGNKGEDAAVAWLVSHGFEILDRNWRHGKLELDIVCRQDEVIRFVEVKTRCGVSYGGGFGAVHATKQRRLLLAAQAWLTSRELWACPYQFDIICLTGAGETLSLEQYPNAFNWETVDNCDSHWQCW